MEQAAQRTAHQQCTPHKGVYVLAVFKRALKIGQRDDLRRTASQCAEGEIHRHRQQALFSQQILDALLNIQQQLTSGAPLLRHVLLPLFDIALLCSDLRLSDGCDEEAHGVGRQQRRDADLIVGKGGHGDHHRRQRLQHAGYGVGLGVVALCDKHRVEALVGHHINTVDRADDQTAHHQHRKIEPAPAEDQRRRQKYPRRDEVQGIDHPLSGEAIQYRTGENGHHDLRHGKGSDIDGVQHTGLCVIQHQQTQRKPGHTVPQHGHHAAQRNDRKVTCPQRGDNVQFRSFVFVAFAHSRNGLMPPVPPRLPEQSILTAYCT